VKKKKSHSQSDPAGSVSRSRSQSQTLSSTVKGGINTIKDMIYGMIKSSYSEQSSTASSIDQRQNKSTPSSNEKKASSSSQSLTPSSPSYNRSAFRPKQNKHIAELNQQHLENKRFPSPIQVHDDGQIKRCERTDPSNMSQNFGKNFQKE